MSIPYVGREIAQANGADFVSFWQTHYADVLGRAKARLMLRYGLQMETPNPQNMLIQMDRNLKPTGRIVFRDVSDAFFVKGISDQLGFAEAMTRDVAAGYEPVGEIRPFVSNSLWRMDEAGQHSVPDQGMNAWTIAHNRAYASEILTKLGFENSPLVSVEQTADVMSSLQQFLQSHQGRAAMRKYAAEADKNAE